MGARLTALDIYLATFLTFALPLAEADCPQMLPRVRPAFAYLVEQIGADVPPALIEHRAHMFRTHLPLADRAARVSRLPARRRSMEPRAANA